MPRARWARHRAGGFVLPATLIALAIVAAVVAYFHELASAALRVAQARNAALEAMLGMQDTQAELLFALATTQASEQGYRAGDGSLTADDRTYRGDRDTRVAIQDMGGLVNLNRADAEMLRSFLQSFGVPAMEVPTLLDTLRDHTDADHLRRAAGAEAPEYAAAGRRPPRNGPLATPMEVRNVLGWSERRGLWGDPRFEALASTAPVRGFNPNTAPPGVLKLLPGLTPETAAALIEQRRVAPLTERSLLAAGGLLPPFGGLPIVARPAETLRVTQWSPAAPSRIRYALTLTPLSTDAPWRVDYRYRIAAPPSDSHADESKLPALPQRRLEAPPPGTGLPDLVGPAKP